MVPAARNRQNVSPIFSEPKPPISSTTTPRRCCWRCRRWPRAREVLVSRGELPAIGGSFKIPEILETSGAKLAEVGTTNKTKISDYEKRYSKETAALLTVHPSNYEVRGYTEKPSFDEIRVYCRKRRLVWIHDLGSGNRLDLSRFGIHGEEKASDAIKAGAELVCFSGDKLFGGPQIGVLAGKKRLVEICRKHPLARALRCEKLTLAAFFATVTLWLRGRPDELQSLSSRAFHSMSCACGRPRLPKSFRQRISARIVETRALFGGGTTPEKSMPSIGLSSPPKVFRQPISRRGCGRHSARHRTHRGREGDPGSAGGVSRRGRADRSGARLLSFAIESAGE